MIRVYDHRTGLDYSVSPAQFKRVNFLEPGSLEKIKGPAVNPDGMPLAPGKIVGLFLPEQVENEEDKGKKKS